ncbi:hypothetical protein SBOR_4759 [Sclerotinia borealis F-4128]|uniref:Uncharacterized protein n=1 Tax=Sclerotinia borealis (strain F-4128) TaxID=1432307 RepID=W9CG39_SCLBF|nr:hypothetical protein SBOR_4759 [Sclerotinia borealis F-4128]
MGLSNKGDSIVVFTLVTFLFIFISIFLIYAPRWVYLKIKNHKKTPSRTEMGNWFQQGVNATVSIMRRRDKVEQEARTRRTRLEDIIEDIEMGDMSDTSSQGKVVVTLPERARVSGGRQATRNDINAGVYIVRG